MDGKSLISTAMVTVVTAVASILTIIATAKVLGPLPISLSQTIAQKQSTFDVKGESEIATIPDNAQVSVGIENRNTSITSAQEKVNSTINAIRTELETLGIDKQDIKTEQYNVYPEYNYESGQRELIGYNVSTSVRITIKDFEKLNSVIDQATAAGANQVGGVQFVLSTQKENELKKQAREEAISKAKDNAKELSSLAGMKLGKIVNVTESPKIDNEPRIMETAMLDAKSSGTPTQIEPGTTKYTYSVTLSYETL